jgi:hypothetical protein
MTAARLIVILALSLSAAAARGENRWDTTTSYFVEPGRGQQLHVIHPQTTLTVDAHRVIGFRIGYDVDIVSGATPRIYGAAPDAISSATSFSDYRHSFHAATEVRAGPTTVGAGYTFSFENDYRSHSVDAGAKVDLWGKNTTFRLGYSHNFDSVCNVDNSGAQPLERRALAGSQGCFDPGTRGLTTEPLAIDSYYAAWTQVLSPILWTDLSMSFQAIDGFQSNPYRRVRLFQGTVDAQESHPTLRQRVAVQAQARLAIKKLRAALGAIARFYWDTWDVKSGTVEVTWDMYLSSRWLIRLRGRFYQQSRALFYRDAGESLSYESVGPVGQYFTGDREMSPFRNWLAGFKLTYARSAGEKGKLAKAFEAMDLSLRLDLMIYDPLTPLPPNDARNREAIDAMIAQGTLTLWF